MPDFPSIDGASGIWSLKKQKRAQQGVNWPTPFNGVNLAYVPYSSTVNGTPNTILVIKTSTAQVLSSISATIASNSRFIRFGEFLLSIAIDGSYWSRNIFTGTQAASGTLVTGPVDAMKIAEDRLGLIYVSGNNLRVRVYNVPSTGIPSSLGDQSIANMSGYVSGYSSPQGGAQVTLDTNAILSSYSGRIALSCVESYPGGINTNTYYAVVNVPITGASATVASSFIGTNNFSRPNAVSGDNGFVLVGQMDMGSAYIFNGTNFPSASTAGNNYNTSYAPAAIHGANGEYMIDAFTGSAMELRKINTSGVTTNISVSTGSQFFGSIQTLRNGCVWAYSDPSDGNKVKYRLYTYSNNSWGSPVIVTGYTGTVNYNRQVVKVVNY
jgi:hypothetical protein